MALTLDGDGLVSGVTGLVLNAPQATGGATTYVNENGVTYQLHTFTSGSSSFVVPSGTVNVEYLVVGGGGAGGQGVNGVNYGSGGAGGTVRAGSLVLSAGSYSVSVGAGGVSYGNGGSSTFHTVTATGGNGSNTARAGANNADYSGDAGGSSNSSGGGAGAGANAPAGGVGGAGVLSTISGSVQYYGGGGGAVDAAVGRAGGIGGGGSGGTTTGTAGRANTGGGGGGASVGNSAAGGSGLVLVRYPVAVGVSAPALIPVASQSFTAASAVSVNNCFTTAYDTYLVIVDSVTGSTTSALNLRLRTSGTDSSTGYYYGGNYGTYAGATGGVGGSNQSSFKGNDFSSSVVTAATYVIADPAAVQHTVILSQRANQDGGATVAGTHQVSTAYDGFTLVPASGTVTGTVRVYGYTN